LRCAGFSANLRNSEAVTAIVDKIRASEVRAVVKVYSMRSIEGEK
jgi:hypothetical protein